GLSSADYTAAEKTKLQGLQNYNDTALAGRITATEQASTATNTRVTTLESALPTKVDKVDGKALSSNDYTNADKTKLASLSNFDSTSLDTAVSGLTSRVATVETGKVDKAVGKGLSTNDYTTAEKEKLATLGNYNDAPLAGRVVTVEGILPNKVDKVTGKGLSTNDYTDAEKGKVAALTN
ncbi:hypothetical protein G3V96_26745, partial [Escherichia coli]|nr:hypothetical protein [Escherichia coli]